MDGTDQLKWGWPQFAEITKKDGVLRLKSHLMIALMNVGGNRDCIIFDTMDNIFHDANLTIECIHRCITFHQDKYDRLPRTLNLQMDNCTRENKNTYMFGFLSWLVERGVFDCIHISFLPVGHTHFCCDQIASRLAVGIKHTTILTQQDFHDLLFLCVTPRPLVVKVRHVADIKGLLNPGLDPKFSDSIVQIPHGMRKPLHFRIVRDADGKTPLVQTKMTASQNEWSQVDYRVFKRPNPADPDKPFYDSKFCLGDVGPSVFKPVPANKLHTIAKNLDRCKVRTTDPAVPRQWADDLEWLTNPIPVDFHWARGGLYLPEIRGRKERVQSSDDDTDVDVEPYLLQRRSSGLYHSYAAMIAADPIEKICIGAWLAIDDRDDDTNDFRYYVAQVVAIDMKNKEQVDVIR